MAQSADPDLVKMTFQAGLEIRLSRGGWVGSSQTRTMKTRPSEARPPGYEASTVLDESNLRSPHTRTKWIA